MVEFDVKIQRFRDKETGELVGSRMFKNIFHASASIAKSAKRSIRVSPRPASPGRPPHTRRRRHMQRAIRFAVDKKRKRAVIGPRESIVGRSAAAHEFGGRFKGDRFKERPFMRPALEKNLHRLGGQFSTRIGG